MKPKEPSQFRILIMSSYPPRECGLATYSQDLRRGLVDKFGQNCIVEICALENRAANFIYPKEVTHTLKVDDKRAYAALAQQLATDNLYDAILIAHEFGLFGGDFGQDLLLFLKENKIPVILNFHTVLPNPCAARYLVVNALIASTQAVVCMTAASAALLLKAYVCPEDKCSVIAHGTALVAQRNTQQLKIKLSLAGRPVLTTFGLLSRGKSIETALQALALVKEKFPNCCYVILGKTHPEVARQEGESYRLFLNELSSNLELSENVHFVDAFVDNELLEDYLQATDVYLFTSTDPNQAVSGTFAYAMACGCPIVSTPIPQAKDALGKAGLVVDFKQPQQMANAIVDILEDPAIHAHMQQAAFQQSKPSAWPNVALQYMRLIENMNPQAQKIKHFELPQYNLNHLKNCTTPIGLLQFCKAEQPLLESGYTVDDNARALIGLVEYYALQPDYSLLRNIGIHFDFIERMQLSSGRFINYLDHQENPTLQNSRENLDDANGRAIWALGTMASLQHMFDPIYLFRIQVLVQRSIDMLQKLASPRALAFSIKGLVKYNEVVHDHTIRALIASMAQKLENLYQAQHHPTHHWFEPKMTYANAVLPEALFLAAQLSQNKKQQDTAQQSFNYLLNLLFDDNQFKVISNQTWYAPGQKLSFDGQQPIDVSYTILALATFYQITKIKSYLLQMKTAFDWYLGNNTLNQIVYNPISGGCLDGLEANEVNINQGAESTVTYLMARNRMEVYFSEKSPNIIPQIPLTLQSSTYDSFRNLQTQKSTSAQR
jgi:glycosyltransferase involved in cell wall biosynthesis